MDLIDRQAAMNILAYGLDKIPMVNNTADEMIRRDERIICIQEIRSLPSAPRWIPVTERLPKPNEENELGFLKAYLVQDGRWMDVARWDGKYWIAWGYGMVLNNVTAWMPLPEPWKGEDND